MTIGIYRLIFKGTNKVYIGQSVDIERRYKEHLNSLKMSTANTKLLNAYNLFGEPTLDILIECTKEELNKTENEAIDIFNSVNNGFNVLLNAEQMPITNNFGQYHGLSQYSNDQVYKAFNLLLDINNTCNYISIVTGVSSEVIRSIASLKAHKWLKEVYLIKYNKLEYIYHNHRNAKKIGYIMDPNNNIFKVSNIRAFCREHTLHQSHISSVLSGNKKQYKGWKLCPLGQV